MGEPRVQYAHNSFQIDTQQVWHMRLEYLQHIYESINIYPQNMQESAQSCWDI